MNSVPVAHMRLDSRDGVAILSIQLHNPVEKLAASVYAHDSVDVAWRAGLQLNATDNPLVWQGAWRLNEHIPPLLEVGNINEFAPTWAPIQIGHPR